MICVADVNEQDISSIFFDVLDFMDVRPPGLCAPPPLLSWMADSTADSTAHYTGDILDVGSNLSL